MKSSTLHTLCLWLSLLLSQFLISSSDSSRLLKEKRQNEHILKEKVKRSIGSNPMCSEFPPSLNHTTSSDSCVSVLRDFADQNPQDLKVSRKEFVSFLINPNQSSKLSKPKHRFEKKVKDDHFDFSSLQLSLVMVFNELACGQPCFSLSGKKIECDCLGEDAYISLEDRNVAYMKEYACPKLISAMENACKLQK